MPISSIMKGRNIRGQQKAMFAKRRKSPIIRLKIRKLSINFSNSVKEISEEVLIDSAKDYIKSKIDNEHYDLKDSFKKNVVNYHEFRFALNSWRLEILASIAQ